ncbi:hypothetical protein [Microbacterium elymi]|uniref:CopC domain-containing protein n=1 Tax=Microbacterium elymi TaxID=2909587 RepID=A0ABY5NIQ7_9MICO|nr:hypothetical protein [Microbacterium elymi]UUT35060.1 hypothetical protein L2X98_32700 [Microbacterium elymi]
MTRFTSHPARLAIGLTAGALLALAVPMAASAHVEVGPDAAPAGGTTPLTFSFHHGLRRLPHDRLGGHRPRWRGQRHPGRRGRLEHPAHPR